MNVLKWLGGSANTAVIGLTDSCGPGPAAVTEKVVAEHLARLAGILAGRALQWCAVRGDVARARGRRHLGVTRMPGVPWVVERR
jgi:hypothetical protein